MSTKPHTTGVFQTKKIAAAAVIAAAMMSASLLAQDAPKNAAATTNAPMKMKTVIVTGSQIPTAATETATPVFALSREEIARTPVRNTSELLRRLPEANGGGVSEIGNATGFEQGASGVSLRGFGAEATLVLLNGRRITSYGDGQNGTDSFVDLNSIPLSIIERLEVLKDGASAIYGADAVAGVVNILTRHDYKGAEVEFGYGNTTQKDMGEITASAIYGNSNDKTSFYVAANYLKRNALYNRDRAYSAITDRRSIGGIQTGSRNSVPGVFIIPRSVAESQPGVIVTSDSSQWNNPGVIPAGSGSTVAVTAGANADWSGGPGSIPSSMWYYGTSRSDLQNRNPDNAPRFNFNAFSGQVPSTERKGFGSEFQQKLIDEQLKFFVEVLYQNVQTEDVLAPGPISNFGGGFGTPITIPSTSPWNPFGTNISGSSSYRPVEFGNRIFDTTTDWTRIVAGFRGTVMENWNYDTAFLWNNSDTEHRNKYVSASAFSGVLDPANTGASLPYNPFASLTHPVAGNGAYASQVQVVTLDKTHTELLSGDFKVNNPQLFELRSGDVGFASGVEYRHEELKTNPDPLASSGDIIGTSPLNPFNANRDVYAWYGEVRVPFTSPRNDIPLLNEFTVDIAGRLENYSDAGFVGVPKVSFQWYPMDKQLMLRGSWSQGFKAPSLFELFNPGSAGLQILDNPYNGENGVEADILRVGNTHLKPEDSESYSLGFVYSPNWLKGLTVHADFWKTTRTGVVDSADFQVLINRAFAYSPDPALANNAFAPSENIFMDLNADGSINFMQAPFDNTSAQTAQGVDFGATYELTTEHSGKFTYAINVTYLDSFVLQQNTSSPPGETAGYAFGDASDALMHWRGNTSLVWDYERYEFVASVNYIGPYRDATDALGLTRDVSAYATLDLQATVNLPKDFSLTVGCNNVLDQNPPLTLTPDINAAEGYISSIYSPVQQFVYMKVTKKF